MEQNFQLMSVRRTMSLMIFIIMKPAQLMFSAYSRLLDDLLRASEILPCRKPLLKSWTFCMHQEGNIRVAIGRFCVHDAIFLEIFISTAVQPGSIEAPKATNAPDC